MFHSVLTPMLNIGLLTPREVLDAVLSADDIPLNSLEGFVRQLIGWREFMRAAYILKGRRQRTRNFWNHERALRSCVLGGENRSRSGRYSHRSPSRACVCASHRTTDGARATSCSLCGFGPDDVYRWFMELFIDAYDWVMVPNVYGMGLYADGGLISTKPYVAGSQLHPQDERLRAAALGAKIWDGLLWAFIDKHRRILRGEPPCRRDGAPARPHAS